MTSPLESVLLHSIHNPKEKFYFNPRPDVWPIIPATPLPGRFILLQKKTSKTGALLKKSYM